MSLTHAIQQYGASTAMFMALNTSVMAASPCVAKQPIQTTASTPIVFVASTQEQQLSLFDRSLAASIIAAPLWLLERMEVLRQMPPPTLQKVRTQWKASAEVRRKLDDSQIV
jgi:hypothetical protein